MKSTCVSTSQSTGRESLADTLQPRVRPEGAPDLPYRSPVGEHVVGGEVVLPTVQRRPDSIRLDPNANPPAGRCCPIPVTPRPNLPVPVSDGLGEHPPH